MFENDLNLHRLMLYRQLPEDEAVQKVQRLAWLSAFDHKNTTEMEYCFYELLRLLIRPAELYKWSGDLWQNHVLELILGDENLYSLACERDPQSISDGLSQLVLKDLVILGELFRLNPAAIGSKLGIDASVLSYNFQDKTPNIMHSSINPEKIKQLKELFQGNGSQQALAAALADFYHTGGCGIMRKYRAFSWDKGLKAIENPDPIKLEDLVGYDYQKQILTANTEAFIRGKKANNILLYGEKGTGKSSSVKALLNKYAGQGLRMIELGKKQLLDLPRIVETVGKRGLHFIVFIDDLSFEDFEVEYKEIKACIDGSLQARPDNLLLYVTSNRRHLIRENWSDRRSSGEEIHVSDTYQEKLSLADRFGIIISYQSPSQEEYLQIINKLARKNNIVLPAEELRKLALQWERRYHGRSGRTAQQFITHITSSSV